MFKVFLGSTFKDLHEHRAAVQAAINRRDDCKAVVMEEFGARAGRPKEVCLEIVGDCDLYVGLVGHCYGFVPDGDSVSITEAEYAAAVEKGLPRLLFLANDGFTPPHHLRESDELHGKQQEFRARLTAGGTVQSFDNDRGVLAARVGEALTRELARLPPRATVEPVTPPVFLPKKGLCVGREDEVARLRGAVLADETEPVVVLGPPGIGKSKVTVAALHDPAVKTRFGARRWFVRLETAPEPAAILGQVALAVGVRPGPDLDARVLSALAVAPALLVLDNTETPWWRDAGGTEAVLETLAQVPELALVCSVRGHKAPARPDWGARLLVPGLDEAAACQLFLRRAGERHAASALLPGLLADIDGVPLAIELLAAQVRADEQGLERVAQAWRAQRSELLASRLGAAHRLDSYEVSLALSLGSPRMTEPARRLYAMMGRLPAGLRSEWADELLPEGGRAAAELLGELGLAFDAAGRLRMLAPIREHAADEELARPFKDRLAGHWLDLALEQGPKVGGPEGANAVLLLGAEWANLERVFDLALADAPARAIDAATALTMLVRIAGLGSSRMLLDAERAAQAGGDTRRAANANESLGDIALARSDHEGARQRYEQALPLYQRVGDVRGEANCIQSLGDIALARSEHEGARQRYEKALPLYQRVGAVLGEANCIQSLGDIALRRSDHDGARQRFEQALPLYQRVGSVLGEANCIKRLGDIALRRSDHEGARQRYEQALPLYRQVGAVLGEANCIQSLGDIALERSEHVGARQRYEQALPLYRQVGSVLGEANCIQSLGDIALERSDHEGARQRYEQALPLYRQVGSVLGEANCIQSLGDIALARSEHEGARQRYEQALPLYRQVGSVLGEANCIRCLGDIALAEDDQATAGSLFEEALSMYRRIQDPYSIGGALVRLARLVEGAARRERVAEARAAWESIDRPDLVDWLEREFGSG